jgi:hypothetical protein
MVVTIPLSRFVCDPVMFQSITMRLLPADLTLTSLPQTLRRLFSSALMVQIVSLQSPYRQQDLTLPPLLPPQTWRGVSGMPQEERRTKTRRLLFK